MLEARSLTKYYNRIAAVSGVSFTIQPRENFSVSWAPTEPTGALRSKVLTGLIEPSEAFYQGRSGTNCFYLLAPGLAKRPAVSGRSILGPDHADSWSRSCSGCGANPWRWCSAWPRCSAVKLAGMVKLSDADGKMLAQDEPIQSNSPMLAVNWRADGQEFCLLSGNVTCARGHA